MEMHWPKLLIFSGFLSPMILSLSHAANPRTIVVKCDGSVYDVDVDKKFNEAQHEVTKVYTCIRPDPRYIRLACCVFNLIRMRIVNW